MAKGDGDEPEGAPEVKAAVRPTERPLPPIPDGAVMVIVKVARFNPDQPEAFAKTGGWQSFRVPCLPSDRMLNLLIYIKSYLDGTLT
ncbi:MAG TPA: succinate dehydrogenase iron-sulfur subunit, partial [Mycobacterium sp.]|nr:succinate dehydrogenase iron-sulfur subunit [Mycobacterium sp.]